jgi:hypothetical protein
MHLTITTSEKYSYIDLFKKYLNIQVWKHSRWTINQLLGNKKIRLIDLVQGGCRRNESLGMLGGGKYSSNRNFMVGFGCLFEEVWDFKFRLKDINLEGYSPFYQNSNSHITFQWAGSGMGKQRIQTCKVNDPETGEMDLQTSEFMNWENLQGDEGFNFTGTWSQLRNKKMVWKISEDGKDPYEKCITLLSLEDNSFLNSIKRMKKVDKPELESNKINIFGIGSSKKSSKGSTRASSREKGSEKGSKRGTTRNSNKSSVVSQRTKQAKELLSDGMTYAKLSAMVIFHKPPAPRLALPMFNHSTPYVQYKSNKSYLFIEIGRASNILVPDNIGIVDSYVEVEWNSQTQRTSVAKDSYSPNFGEQLLFKIHTISKIKRYDMISNRENLAKDPSLRDKFYNLNKDYFAELRDILYEGSQIDISVWLENFGKSQELSGTCNILLSEYRDLDTDVFIKYDWLGERQVELKCYTKSANLKCHNASKPNSNMTLSVTIGLLPPEIVEDQAGTSVNKTDRPWIDFGLYNKRKSELLFAPEIRGIMRNFSDSATTNAWVTIINDRMEEAKQDDRQHNFMEMLR